jgi:hypothetical protein
MYKDDVAARRFCAWLCGAFKKVSAKQNSMAGAKYFPVCMAGLLFGGCKWMIWMDVKAL